MNQANGKIELKLRPLNRVLYALPGTALRDLLFLHGVEFPCGGRGRCKGCRVRVLEGDLPATPEDRQALSPQALNEGWRLCCRAHLQEPLVLSLAQWETAVLSDNSSFHFEPGKGLGIAVDLGTTTLCAQLLDRETGAVLAVRSGLNRQARHGADLMSRIEFAVGDGQKRLEEIIRRQVGQVIRELLLAADPGHREVTRIVLVGNTAMHHLFCGVDVRPLSEYPFEPDNDGLIRFAASEIGWRIPGDPVVCFLPGLGGFVGSDLLAGILATGLADGPAPRLLVDLGTNGEIVIGNREKVLCASTAAGPAFEGARISMGMRADTGAVSEASWVDGKMDYRVIGGGEPRGICGSGLVDLAAAMLEAGSIQRGGRFVDRSDSVAVAGRVRLSQGDVRELQLAKGAIAAGIRILMAEWGAGPSEVTRLDLAGAFGNYINRRSARRIGLIDFPLDRINPAGNTALLGAKMALFQDDLRFEEIRSKTRHISLSANPDFQDIFVDEMLFRENSGDVPSAAGKAKGGPLS